MDALSPRAKALPRLTGRPLHWARDLSWVGTATAAGVALALGLGTTVLGQAAVAAGALAGFGLGLEMPAFLESARRRLPLPMVGLRIVVAGAAMGGFVGLASATVAGTPFVLGPMVIGGLAGALQLGWWWLPYTILTVTDRPTWPAVVVACLLAPAVGPLAKLLADLLVAVIL